jgi:hypothetical protein
MEPTTTVSMMGLHVLSFVPPYFLKNDVDVFDAMLLLICMKQILWQSRGPIPCHSRNLVNQMMVMVSVHPQQVYLISDCPYLVLNTFVSHNILLKSQLMEMPVS